MSRRRTDLLRLSQACALWLALVAMVLIPLVLASRSPLLEWRQPIYIIAGFAGILAFTLMLIQPLLAAAGLTFVSAKRSAFLHRLCGASIVLLVIVHVCGLWVTSPPDVIDALLFVSATPFSLWGVVAMWSLFIAATLVLLRRKFRHHRRHWSVIHRMLAVVTVSGTVAHTLMIEGTMEALSKTALCIAVVACTLFGIFKRRLPN